MQHTFNTINELIQQRAEQRLNAAKNKQSIAVDEAVKNTKDLHFEFSREYFGAMTRKAITSTVQFSQSGATMLLNRVHEYHLEEPSEFYRVMESALSGFINFLRKNFPSHFDHTQPMPMVLWQPIETAYTNCLKALDEKNTEPGLLNVLRNEIAENTSISTPDFRTGQYWQQLTTAMGQLQHDYHRLTNELIEALISRNFNSGHFVLYVIEWCAGGLSKEEAPITHWSNVLRLINRIPVKPGLMLYLEIEPCKQLLVQAITTELFALERLENTDRFETKIVTPLSVNQFGLMLRLMVDSQILKPDNTREMLRFFSHYFKTSRTAEISYKSLEQRFYNTDLAAKSILKTYLINMMSLLKNY